MPQYYVEHSHPAIIEVEEWALVQVELERRKTSGKRYMQTSIFSGKIFCGDCGEIYGSKVWHSNSKYRRTIWQCNRKFRNEKKCATPHLYEAQIKELFLAAISEYLADHDGAIEDLRYAQSVLTNNDFIDVELKKLEQELAFTAEMMRACIDGNARNTLTEAEYDARYEKLSRSFEETE